MKKLGIADRIFLLAAVICLAAALTPYSVLKGAADTLSPDGNMERFTPETGRIFCVGMAACFILFAGLVIWKL